MDQSKEGTPLSGPLYPNQPLVEVATEVRFEGDLNVEMIRPKYQGMIRDQYPRLMVSGAQEGVAPSLQPIRFEDEDKRSGMQLAINSFSYFSHEYPGHEVFLAQATEKLGMFLGLLGAVRVTRVGWRYINSLPFTRENGSLPLSRFFQDNDVFGNALKDDFEDLSCHLSMPKKGKHLNVKLQSALSTVELGAETLILDIDAFGMYSPSVSMDAPAVMAEIHSMHNLAYDTFESLISDNYRAYLKGGSDAE